MIGRGRPAVKIDIDELIRSLVERTVNPAALPVHTKLQLLRKIEAAMPETSASERTTLEALRERLL
jgi:antitoxin component of RelBE/YafQ-DinJ toxin-antitoxin module